MLNTFEKWLRQGRDADQIVRYRQMALQLALLDFETPESLDGVRIDDLVLKCLLMHVHVDNSRNCIAMFLACHRCGFVS